MRGYTTFKKAWLLALCAVVVLVFAFSRDSFALHSWEKYGRADIALLFNSTNSDLALQLGDYYFGVTSGRNEFNLAKAERSYSQAVAIKYDIPRAHYQLARIYFVKGDFADALSEINEELRLYPENLRALYTRGLIYGFTGKANSAEADFRGFVSWAPKEWAGYNDLAWILTLQKKG